MIEDIPSHKTCSRCKITKPMDGFHNSTRGKYGRHSYCRVCQSEVRIIWYASHREEQVRKSIEFSKTDLSKARRKKHYDANRETILDRERKRRKTEAFKIGARKRAKKFRQGLQGNPSARMAYNLRGYLYKVLKGAKKQGKTIELCGCTVRELIQHIESTWKVGMGWDNYGVHGWHVDHILPCAAFDLTTAEEQRKCFHYTNLQALWAKENIQKRDYVPDYQI